MIQLDGSGSPHEEQNMPSKGEYGFDDPIMSTLVQSKTMGTQRFEDGFILWYKARHDCIGASPSKLSSFS